MEKINIKKILDFPLTNGRTDIDVEGYISIQNKTAEFSMENGYLGKLYPEFKSESKDNKEESWFAIDKDDRKITLVRALYVDGFPSAKFLIHQEEIVVGAHLTDDTKVKKIQSTIHRLENNLDFALKIGNREFIYNDLKIRTQVDKEFVISIEGEIAFGEIKKLFRYFCELIFLFYGIYPECDSFKIVLLDDNTCELMTNGNKFKYERRRKALINELKYGKTDYKTSLKNFIVFRENSGLIFDIFLSTVYSQSFEEDYPLRFSQCIEGVMNYGKLLEKKKSSLDLDRVVDNLKICKEYLVKYCKGNDSITSCIELLDSNKDILKNIELENPATFKDIITKAIKYNKYLESLFNNDDEIEKFAKKTKAHRNLFSHAKHKSDRFEGKENMDASIKLYTILRFIIIDAYVNEDYFNWIKERYQ